MSEANTPARSNRRRPLAYWSAAAALAIAAPLAGHLSIQHAIDTELVPALERATGETVELEGVEVSLLGSVALIGLDLGDFIAAERIEGRVAMGSLLAGRLSADEIEIQRPRIDLRQGGRRLRRLVTHLHARRGRAPAAPPSASGPARWPNLRVSGGELRVRSSRGEMAIRSLRARPVGAGLRLVTGPVELAGTLGGQPLELDFARSAVDLDTASGRLERAVALAGRGRWGAVPIESASLVDGERRLRARARLSGGQITAERRGGVVVARLAAIPAAAVAPLLGSLELSGGTISGTVTVRARRARAELSLEDVAGHLSWLASEPVDLSSEVRADVALVDGDNPRLDIAEVAVTRGPLVARLRGTISDPSDLDRSAGQLRLTVDEVGCAELLEALPTQLSGALRGMRLGGRVSADLDARFDLGRPAPESVSLAVDLDASRCEVRGEAPLYVAGLADSDTLDLEPLPEHVPASFLVAEDGRFHEHHGFDLEQIEASLAENLEARDLLRGGSTITQQLAKNLFLGTERTVARKLQEAVLAWRLEATFDKSELLARYLAVIQLGVEVRGLEAAARHWFAKPAAELSPREAAFLACLTRAPATLERAVRANAGPDPELARRVDNLLASLRFSGAISMATYRRAMAEELELAPLQVASLDAEE